MDTGSHEKLMSLLGSFDTAMLVTVSREGRVHSRPMALFQVTPLGELWFMTSLSSGKVGEITADSHVNVALQKDNAFVSICGVASLHRDRAKVQELWKEHARVYFPKGKDDPDIALIKVTGQEAEYWDNQGAQGIKYLFEAAKAYLTGTRPEEDTGRHGSVPLTGASPR